MRASHRAIVTDRDWLVWGYARKWVYRVEDLLPIWAQPHSFALLHDGQREVFTFPLVLAELPSLGRLQGVRSLGRQVGFEWLPGLSDGVQRETKRRFPRSELELFLEKEHGIAWPTRLSPDDGKGHDRTAGEPDDDILRAFARGHGANISRWAANAFDTLRANLADSARAQERVPPGLGSAARQRLRLTGMRHTLRPVYARDGSEHWAREYGTLYERVALELEDLAIRRPIPDTCPVCDRLYIPIVPTQAVCGNQLWDVQNRSIVRLCMDASEAPVSRDAEAADYRTRRKSRWAAMNRARDKYGEHDPRTKQAIAEWETWRDKNRPPRQPGRPRGASPLFSPVVD